MLQTYRQTDRHTEPQTKRVLEEHSLLKMIDKEFKCELKKSHGPKGKK